MRGRRFAILLARARCRAHDAAMTISRIAFVLAGLAATQPLAAAERVETVTSFDRVRVDGPYRVEIVTGRGSSARLSGDRQALDRVTVDVQGRILTIRANRSAWTGGWPGEDKAAPVLVRLTTGELRSISVSGSSAVSVDRLRGPMVQLAVTGSGRLEVVRAETDRLELALIGSGALSIAGTAKAANAIVRGSGSIEGAGLTANDLTVSSASAGTIAIGARNSAKVKASGSGEVRIGGTPACTITALGSGQVYCGAEKK
jgi:hypothetical protein